MSQTEADVEAKFDTGYLPDWLISPEEYMSHYYPPQKNIHGK